MRELLPHLVPQPGMVDLGHIAVHCDEELVPGDVPAHWTPFSRWTVRWHVDADIPQLSRHLKVTDTQLRAALLWTSPEARTGGVVAEKALTSSTDLLGSVDGIMGGSLMLRGVLVADGRPSEEPLAPSSPGSFLAETRRRLILSGNDPRFPVLRLSFGRTNVGHPDALWALEVDLTDPETDASVALHLYVNDDHPRVDDLLRHNPAEDLSVILRWDIQRQTVLAVIRDEAVDGLPEDLPPGSVGAVARRALQVCLGTGDVQRARSLFRSDYHRFEATIQARGLLFNATPYDHAALSPT